MSKISGIQQIHKEYMELYFDSILGANVGFEILTREMLEVDGEEDGKWGFLLDLLFVRLIFIKH